jgi:endonuclease/exonuclease/phosphatase family metal-dependent hydrolase
MKLKPWIFSLALLVVPVLTIRAETTTNPPLCVMTYNLRYASSTPPNAWPDRRPLVREVIQSIKPDVIGTQEGLHAQLLDVATDLPDYSWVGVGRNDGKTNNEFMAVFYLKSRLEALSTNHFWLSDTPEISGSATWGNSNRRMVTWLKFRDRATGGEFFFFNTHFDHQVQLAREKSAELLRKRVTALETKLPVLLVGDFNANAGRNKAYAILTEDNFFKDSWTQAKERRNEGWNSFNGFKAPEKNDERIDWILTRGGIIANRAEIVLFERNGQFPSDHFPVVSSLQLPPPGPKPSN